MCVRGPFGNRGTAEEVASRECVRAPKGYFWVWVAGARPDAGGAGFYGKCSCLQEGMRWRGRRGAKSRQHSVPTPRSGVGVAGSWIRFVVRRVQTTQTAVATSPGNCSAGGWGNSSSRRVVVLVACFLSRGWLGDFFVDRFVGGLLVFGPQGTKRRHHGKRRNAGCPPRRPRNTFSPQTWTTPDEF